MIQKSVIITTIEAPPVDKLVDKSVTKPVDKPVDKPDDKPVDKLDDKPCHCTSQAKPGRVHPWTACMSTLTAYETLTRHLVTSTQPNVPASDIIIRVCIWRVQSLWA